MSLTRSMLKAMGIEDATAEEIIKAHVEVTDSLKQERDEIKTKYEAASASEEELAKVKRELEELKSDPNDFKAKYEKAKKDFDDFKAGIAKEKESNQKQSLYREMLKAAGVDEKRIEAIIKVTDMDAIEIDGDKLKDSETLAENIKTEWAGFIVNTGTKGAKVDTPPANGGADSTAENIKAVRKAMGLPEKE